MTILPYVNNLKLELQNIEKHIPNRAENEKKTFDRETRSKTQPVKEINKELQQK